MDGNAAAAARKASRFSHHPPVAFFSGPGPRTGGCCVPFAAKGQVLRVLSSKQLRVRKPTTRKSQLSSCTQATTRGAFSSCRVLPRFGNDWRRTTQRSGEQKRTLSQPPPPPASCSPSISLPPRHSPRRRQFDRKHNGSTAENAAARRGNPGAH